MDCPDCSTRLKRDGFAESGRQRWKCRTCGLRTTNPLQQSEDKVTFPDRIPKSSRYLITSAQNATPAFKPFLASLKRYAKHIDAKLIIIPFRYKNPTSQWSENNETHEWWAKELVPYLYDGRFDLNEHLTIMADVKVQPTAVNPLTGLEGITGAKSAIVGHPRLQFKTVATPSHKLPKIMTTTGAVTVKNYTDTKAGKKGEFHHTPGACIAELRGKKFHLRQIVACKDGSFIDLDKSVTTKGIKKAPPALALAMGDSHIRTIDPAVVRATFTDKGSMVNVLKPERLIWDDLLDFYSRNPHHRGDPISLFVKHQAGVGNVRDEVFEACDFVDEHTPKNCESVVVSSNHVTWMLGWIKDTDWRHDPENAEFYLETALAVLRSSSMTPGGAEYVDPFFYWAAKRMKCKARLLRRDESYSVMGVEYCLHGDQGQNGARGNIKGFANIGTKTTVAHGHSPGIEGGCHQVGTSTFLHLEYTSGASSWLQTHDVLYANGKRSLLSIIDGEWRL